MNVPKRKRSVIAFTDALCRLLCDTPLKKLSVTSICSEAGYTPMAFYSSFQNKNDFAYSVVDYEAQVFASCVYDQLEQFSTGENKIMLHRQYITDYFEHVSENRKLFHCILNNQLMPDGIALLSKRIAHYMCTYMTLRSEAYPEMENFTAFVLEITAAQMLMVVRYWLGKASAMEPQTAAELYCDQFLFRSTVSFEQDPESGTFYASL